MQALEEKLIGLSMTNTSPIVYPTRSNSSTFGTNPITFAAPAKKDDSFVLDMATSSVALGKLEIWQVKQGAEEPMPANTWAANKDGIATTDSRDVLGGGGMY